MWFIKTLTIIYSQSENFQIICRIKIEITFDFTLHPRPIQLLLFVSVDLSSLMWHLQHVLGGIHKLRHTLRGAEGVDEMWHYVTWGEGILNFVTSHLENSIKAILNVSTKLKQFHWKALNIAQLNQYTHNDIQCSLSCPKNENDGTTMPVINDIKEWIWSPWTQDV